MSIWGIVVAAGKGERARQGRNKVYVSVGGRSVLSRCLDALTEAQIFDGLILVIAQDDEDLYQTLCEREGKNPLVKSVVFGGDCRRRSVYHGLQALPEDAQIVAVHDAARPFVRKEVIQTVIRAAQETGSGIISTPVTDTIKQILPDGKVRTLERGSLRAVQTPQAFDAGKLLEAHQKAEEENYPATDDASLFEHYYGSVTLVTAPGAEENIKLTTKTDFDHLAQIPFRVGTGYDAHRLKEGRKLILCGVEIPHDRGLDGHSDADVAVHALMDALLGAVGERDIGLHFPPSDMQYKDISSMLLLQRVMQIVRKHGYKVGNVDVTIVAQKPKLSAFIPQMRENLAAALGTDAVNVKATTTEHMGFEGEEIGISAQAAALLMEDRG